MQVQAIRKESVQVEINEHEVFFSLIRKSIISICPDLWGYQGIIYREGSDTLTVVNSKGGSSEINNFHDDPDKSKMKKVIELLKAREIYKEINNLTLIPEYRT